MKTLREQASAYWSLLYGSSCLCEPETVYAVPFEASERHIQSLWFDSPFCPRRLTTLQSETVQVVDPGRWNPEAGPDFINAELIVEPGGRHIRGDVEIHVRPGDWDRHAHDSDARYRSVVLHVTWFEGPPAKSLPSGVLNVALRETVCADPDFSFDRVDTQRLPSEAIAVEGRPCRERFLSRPERLEALLKAAGYYRMWIKTRQMTERLTASGGDLNQVFYEALMGVMGYRNNTLPFRRLAREVPYAALAGKSCLEMIARLSVTSGLLPEPDKVRDSVRSMRIRGVWDRAWALGVQRAGVSYEWNFAGTRPANHPLRRLGAVVAMLGNPEVFWNRLPSLTLTSSGAFEAWRETIRKASCWPVGLSEGMIWSGGGIAGDAPLLGESRAQSVVTNAVIPLLLAQERLPVDLLTFLPAEELASSMKETAARLTGSVKGIHKLLSNGLFQQGLLQIASDFCRNGRNICSRCAVPGF